MNGLGIITKESKRRRRDPHLRHIVDFDPFAFAVHSGRVRGQCYFQKFVQLRGVYPRAELCLNIVNQVEEFDRPGPL